MFWRWILGLLALPIMAFGQDVRIATFYTELSQKGPGLLYHKLLSPDAQSIEVAQIIAQAHADIIVLQGIDYDADLLALTALRDLIAKQGTHYPHLFATQPNTGLPMATDVNGDGHIATPQDTQSYGYFIGQNGIAILSMYPIGTQEIVDFTPLLWRDVSSPDNPRDRLFANPEIWQTQRLSYTAHWVLPVEIKGSRLTLLTSHNSPPVFDGPEDRNGWRNHDETLLWTQYLDGAYGPPPSPVVYAGVLNADPLHGDARKTALHRLLTHPTLQDPLGPAPTVNWPSTGPLRVSYILPAKSLHVTEHGQIAGGTASRHALLWLDIALKD